MVSNTLISQREMVFNTFVSQLIQLQQDGKGAISGPSNSPGLNPRTRVLQCLESTSALGAGEICFFEDVPYVCTVTKPEISASNDNQSSQCIDHIAANIACSDGTFLCKKSLSEIEAVGGWAQHIH